jgi:hypothetical protein
VVQGDPVPLDHQPIDFAHCRSTSHNFRPSCVSLVDRSTFRCPSG